MIKKTILYVMIIGAFISTKAQNDSIGIYPIYEANNEYYLLYGNDTIPLDKYGITIKFKEQVTEPEKNSFKTDYNLTYVRETVGSYVYYSFLSTNNYILTCDSMYNDSRVQEFVFDLPITLQSFTPNDEDVVDQWYLDMIDAFEAWDITMGSEDVIVAVIDEGLFIDHEDIGDEDEIRENIFHNPGEDEWSSWDNPNTGNIYDDDENDKLNDWKGWNFANYTGTVPNQYYEEDNSVIPEQDWGYHGTAVSGIISATTNNGIDMAGIAGGNYAENIGGAKVLPIKIMDWNFNGGVYWEQVGRASSVPAAIEYAIEMGADIINMSFMVGELGDVPPNLLNPISAALEYAYNSPDIENNPLLVASAGNQGSDFIIAFPASSQYVMAIGASDIDNEDWEYSNNGNDLEMVAPGVDILSLDNQYTNYGDGTSYSAPMVSATAALMLSVKSDLENTEIREILRNTAEKVGSHPYQNGWNKYMGYGRLNTYYAVCEVLKLLDPITVITSDTWDEPVYSLHDIVVETGKTLTITSTVSMGNEARFIIKPGATVILDGGTLTNYKFCGHEDNLWPGMEVWGNADIHQFDCNGILEQGKLTILNGGTIENAEIGVLLGARDMDNEGQFIEEKAGGIIQVAFGGNPLVNDATFLNNRYAIRFRPYQNYTYDPFTCENTRKNGNLSYLKNCYFGVNEDYLGGLWSYALVHLSSVDGIKFYGCTFEYTQKAGPHGHGINAYGSGFTVRDICNSGMKPCPVPDQDRCTFTNFKKAINSLSSGMYTATVENTEFFNNSRGVVLSNVNNATVLTSNFHIGEPADCGLQTDAGIGIDLEDGTGFALEENYFTKAQGMPAGVYIGIRVKDSQTQYDLVYKNTYEGLSYGNFAEGDNRLIGDDLVGLEYQCNTNTGNNIDFIVTTDDPLVNPQIRTFQGTQDKEAGNSFSSNAQWHFKNDGTQVIDYFYKTNPPLYYTLNYVVPINVNDENSCPSHYGGTSVGTPKSVVLSPGQKEEAELAYAANLSDYNNVKALFDNLKDGGNTGALQNEVALSWPNDMWELRAELLGKSPHLSKEVLMTAADKTDVLPESILFEILSANPDELRKDELIKYLEDKDQPLPGYMVSILRQLAGGITYKTILLQDMAGYNAAKTQAAYDLVRSCLNDTVTDYQYLRNWLGNLDNLNADIQIVSSYIKERDNTSAQALLDMMPGLYMLEGDALNDYNDYKSLMELQMAWQQEGQSIFELDSMDVVALIGYADNGNGKAAIAARNLLGFAYGYEYCNCPPVGDSSVWKSSGIAPLAQTLENALFIEATPNPAKTYVAFNYLLPIYVDGAVLQINDMHGRAIASFVLNAKQGQQVWDIRKVDRGVYLYTLKTNGISKSGKLIIE